MKNMTSSQSQKTKTIILTGGFGTRLSEETLSRPKPMVEIGAKPILWHIMKVYAHYGFNEFILALGYKADYIKKILFRVWTLFREYFCFFKKRSGRNLPKRSK